MRGPGLVGRVSVLAVSACLASTSVRGSLYFGGSVVCSRFLRRFVFYNNKNLDPTSTAVSALLFLYLTLVLTLPYLECREVYACECVVSPRDAKKKTETDRQ